MSFTMQLARFLVPMLQWTPCLVSLTGQLCQMHGTKASSAAVCLAIAPYAVQFQAALSSLAHASPNLNEDACHGETETMIHPEAELE